MENISSSLTLEHHDLICPITLCVYKDPVLAGDGHVYERNAIVQWIEQQGTSPLTREPLNIDDLHSEENIKQICQSYRLNTVRYSCQSNTISLPSTIESNSHCEQEISCRNNCNIKRILSIIVAIILIISTLIIAISIIVWFNSKCIPSMISTTNKYSKNYTYPFITYPLPNNCTLPKVTSLFKWTNAQSFNYTYYSKLYNAVSTQTVITFLFQHGVSSWCIDDISVIDQSSQTELIINGNFENNPSNGFIRCNSYGQSLSSIESSHPFNGKRSFCTNSIGVPDYFCQTLNTKIGQSYRISFWLENNGNKPNIAEILMSY